MLHLLQTNAALAEACAHGQAQDTTIAVSLFVTSESLCLRPRSHNPFLNPAFASFPAYAFLHGSTRSFSIPGRGACQDSVRAGQG